MRLIKSQKRLYLIVIGSIMLAIIWSFGDYMFGENNKEYSILSTIIHLDKQLYYKNTVLNLIAYHINTMWAGILGAVIVTAITISEYYDAILSGNIKFILFRKGRIKYSLSLWVKPLINSLFIILLAVLEFHFVFGIWFSNEIDVELIGDAISELVISFLFFIAISEITGIIIMFYNNLFFCLSLSFIIAFFGREIFLSKNWLCCLIVILICAPVYVTLWKWESEEI